MSSAAEYPKWTASVLHGYQRPLKRPVSAHYSISPSNILNYFEASFIRNKSWHLKFTSPRPSPFKITSEFPNVLEL
jgi:hypothetical protein